MCNTEMKIIYLKGKLGQRKPKLVILTCLPPIVCIPLYECFILRATAKLEQLAKLKEMQVALKERICQTLLILPPYEHHHVVHQFYDLTWGHIVIFLYPDSSIDCFL